MLGAGKTCSVILSQTINQIITNGIIINIFFKKIYLFIYNKIIKWIIWN